MKHGYLIDMDGVIYRGSEVIPGAAEFIRHLQEERIPYLFLTNNSAYTPLDVVVKLRKFDIETTADHVYTAALATAEFVHRQKPNGTAFVIGEGGILNALNDVHYAISRDHPDFVIVAEGRVLNFEMAEQAHRFISAGAHLISDKFPTLGAQRTMVPGPAAAPSSPCSNRPPANEPTNVGKPNPFMMRLARKRIGLATDEVIMVGDTMDTGHPRRNRPRLPKHPRSDRLYHAQIPARISLFPDPRRRIDRRTGALAGPGCRLIQWLG
jgi:NagD protein